MEKTIHQGRNVKRFREMLGIKQGAFAADMGDEWTQDKISRLEQKEQIDDKLLDQIAGLLKLPVEAIKNFDEEQAVNIIANTVTTVNDNATGQLFQINPVINSMEKWMEALEEIKRLNTALLKEKDDKIAMMEKLLDKK